MNATVPLEEALPWSPETPRKILICDSIETDGSFLLHTFAGQILKNSSDTTSTVAVAGGDSGGHHFLWWLTARPVTDRQIATGLKKIGCDAAASYLRKPTTNDPNSNLHPSLQITSLATEISTKVLEGEGSPGFDGEQYLKEMYRKIKAWATTTPRAGDGEFRGTYWIFLDDVSSLASIVGDGGEGLVYQFVDSIHSLTTRNTNLGSVVRCSYELDHTLLKNTQLEETQDKTGWLGAGGMAQKEETKYVLQNWIPWERTIVSMDSVVDVVPLSSGYSREAHGRLVFSEYPGGQGWGGIVAGSKAKQGSIAAPSTSAWNKFVINYCLQDNGVRAIRLRESSGSAT